jgi:predicted DNA-binding transcriptional regulator AlpA
MSVIDSNTPQGGVAEKATAPKAHPPRAPLVHLLDKAEVCAITNVTFPTIWSWMRAGTFPRSRVVGGKSMWRSDEVEQWLASLPVRALKGDDVEGMA